jgi:anion-transporting  ArsA/GET3 family ATPase
VCNYRLDRALHDYFVNHLHLGFFYRRVVAGSQIQRLIDAAPGIAELLFIGQLFWLTTLAADEVGLDFDRLIVDAPATGHGASLLDLPATLRSIGATGLLGLEIDRVTRMMNDPAQVGVWVATTPEELAIEETLQLVPRIARDLQRTPLAIAVNRSVTHFGPANATGPWLEGMLRQLPIESQTTAETMRRSLQQRVIRESALRSDLQDATQFGMVSLDDQLTLQGEALPRAVIEAVSTDIEKWWENLA